MSFSRASFQASFMCLLLSRFAFTTTIREFELTTFSEVRDALLAGSRLQLTAQTEQCVVSEPDSFRYVNMVLKQWQLVTSPDGVEEIRADDFNPTTFGETSSFSLRTVNIYDDGSVKITLSGVVGDVQTDPLIFECVLNSGAVVRHVVDPKDLIPITYFNGLKSHVLGERIEVIGHLHECLNADEVFQEGTKYIVGYQIFRYQGNRDGADDEDIVFDDFALLSADGTSFSLAVEKVTAIKEGERADVTTVIFDGGDLSATPVVNFTLNCVINESIFFSRHEREPTEVSVTYAEVRRAALAGFEIQASMSLEFCSQLEGEIIPTAGIYVGVQFDQFQLFRAGGPWGGTEYIAFSGWGLTVEGDVYLEVIRFYQDSAAVTVEYLVEARDGSGIIRSGKFSCPTFLASFFHLNGRVRDPVDSFESLMTDMAAGWTFEVLVDFDGCDTGGAELSSIYGGVAWQAYFDPIDGYYAATVFSLVNQEVTDEKGIGWQVASIIVTSDLNVDITARLYDFVTGDLIPGNDMAIRCTMKTSDSPGAVQLFRFP